MATLASIERQIAALQKKADTLRKAETAAAAAKVKALIAQHGLTADDLGLPGAKAKGGKAKVKLKPSGHMAAAPKRVGAAKYQDSQTGKTWTGVGKPPAWIAGAKNRYKFLIATAAASSAGDAATPQGAKKPAGVAVKKTKSPVKQPATAATAVSEATKAAPTKKSARKPKGQVSGTTAAADSATADAT
jgi:DNA-binding protein H-NS